MRPTESIKSIVERDSVTRPDVAVALAASLAAVGIGLLLSRYGSRQRKKLIGASMIAVGLAINAPQLVLPGDWTTGRVILFYLMAAAVVATAVVTVVARDEKRSAVAFITLLLATAGLLFFARPEYWEAVACLAAVGGIGACLRIFAPAKHDRGLDVRENWEPFVSAAVGMAIVGVCAVAMRDALSVVGVWLFGVGAIGVLSRRRLATRTLSVVIMFLGSAVGLAAWPGLHGDSPGPLLVVAILVVAGCQPTVLLNCRRSRDTPLEDVPEGNTPRFEGLALALGLLTLLGALLAA